MSEKGANSRVDRQTGPMRRRQADRRKRCRRGPGGTDGRMGGLGDQGLKSADGGSGGWANGRTRRWAWV